MRFATMDADEVGVLPPIPRNVMDIARARVAHALGGIKRTAPHDGGGETSTEHSPTAPTPSVSRGGGGNAAVQSILTANSQKPTFFKDAQGNEYRMKNGRLYIKGWFDTSLKFRLLNATSGKELSLENKKIQVYGWHVVEKVTDEAEIKAEEDGKADEIENVEEEAEGDD